MENVSIIKLDVEIQEDIRHNYIQVSHKMEK